VTKTSAWEMKVIFAGKEMLLTWSGWKNTSCNERLKDKHFRE